MKNSRNDSILLLKDISNKNTHHYKIIKANVECCIESVLPKFVLKHIIVYYFSSEFLTRFSSRK